MASDGREHEYLATDSTSTGSGYGAVVIGVFSSSRVRGIPDENSEAWQQSKAEVQFEATENSRPMTDLLRRIGL